MMTKNKSETNSRRNPYQKPKLEQVQLVVDEVVLAACKGTNIVGPGRPAGSQCTHPSKGPCSSIGGS
jgi:hypothetical protein